MSLIPSATSAFWDLTNCVADSDTAFVVTDITEAAEATCTVPLSELYSEYSLSVNTDAAQDLSVSSLTAVFDVSTVVDEAIESYKATHYVYSLEEAYYETIQDYIPGTPTSISLSITLYFAASTIDNLLTIPSISSVGEPLYEGVVYQGVSVTQEDGIIIQSTDDLYRAQFNSSLFTMQHRTSTDNNYTDAIYFDSSTKKITIAGDVSITGLEDNLAQTAAGNLIEDVTFINNNFSTSLGEVVGGVYHMYNNVETESMRIVIDRQVYSSALDNFTGRTYTAGVYLYSPNLNFASESSYLDIQTYVEYSDGTSEYYYRKRYTSTSADTVPTEMTLVEIPALYTDENKQVTTFILRVAVNLCSGDVYVKGYSIALNELSQIDVFNALTNNGATEGLYLSNSELYINASYIQTGTLSADLISTGILQDNAGGNNFYLNVNTGELRLNANSISIGGTPIATQSQITAAAAGNLLTDPYFETSEDNEYVQFNNGVVSYTDNAGWYLLRRYIDSSIYDSLSGSSLVVSVSIWQDSLVFTSTSSFMSAIFYVKYSDNTESYTEVIAFRAGSGASGSDVPSSATSYTVDVTLADKTVSTASLYVDIQGITGTLYASDWRVALAATDVVLTQTAVFNALTNNGASQGVYLYNGELYINATYIQSGSINADLITTGTINADLIKAGTMVGGIDATEPGEVGTSVYFNLDDATLNIKTSYRSYGASLIQNMYITSEGVYCQNNNNNVFSMRSIENEDGTRYGVIGVGDNVSSTYAAYMRGDTGLIACASLTVTGNLSVSTISGYSVAWIPVYNTSGTLRYVLGRSS